MIESFLVESYSHNAKQITNLTSVAEIPRNVNVVPVVHITTLGGGAMDYSQTDQINSHTRHNLFTHFYKRKHHSSKSLYPRDIIPLRNLRAKCIGRVDSLGPGPVSLKPGQPVFFDTTVRARDNPTTIMLQGRSHRKKTADKSYRSIGVAEKILCPVGNVHGIPEELLERYGVGKLSWLTSTLVPYGGLLAGGIGGWTMCYG